MRIQSFSVCKLMRVLAVIMTMLVILSGFAGIGLADYQINSSTVIAGWDFSRVTATSGFIPATQGVNKNQAQISSVGTDPTYAVTDDGLKAYNWYSPNNVYNKYWLAKLSTLGYKTITLSSMHTGSGSGPKDFKVQVSLDNSSWTDVQNSNITIQTKDVFVSLTNLQLPDTCANRSTLYIRWIMRDNKAIDSSANPNGVPSGSGPRSSIKNVAISGTAVSGPVELSSITLDSASYSLNINQTHQTTVTALYSDGSSSPVNTGVTYTSSNTAIATVDTNGLVTGKAAGQTVITALYGGKTATAAVTVLTGSGSKTPTLLNMTFNGDPKTSMAFDWYTPITVTGTVVQVIEASRVVGGVFPEQGATAFTGTTETISTIMTTGDRSKSDSDSSKYKKFACHKVIASNLTPGTQYAYRAGNGDSDGWSPVGTFTTDTANNQDFHFLVATDTQGSDKQNFQYWGDTFKRAIAQVGDPKFMAITGDLTDDGDCEEQYQWFLGIPQNEYAKVPIVPVQGNHETNDQDYPNNNFYYHFNLPKDVGIGYRSGMDNGSVYSFEYGNALFMVMNTQYEGELGSSGSSPTVDPQFNAQVKWMRNQVAKTNKKWKFVLLHKSPYSAGDNAKYEDDRVQFYRQYLIPVFDEMGIDVIFQGHDHMYMRSYQMAGNKVQSVTTDGAGNILNPKGTNFIMSNSGAEKFYEKVSGYNDFFAAIDTQPYKKMFVDVSVTEDILKLTAYTAAQGEALKAYDQYSIKRTDTNPLSVINASARLSGSSAVISWGAPSDTSVRGYRIYEKNDKAGTNWSIYVPVVSGQTTYSYTASGIDASKRYEFVIKAVGVRNNSDPVIVSTN